MPRWYFAHAQDGLNLCILHLFEGICLGLTWPILKRFNNPTRSIKFLYMACFETKFTLKLETIQFYTLDHVNLQTDSYTLLILNGDRPVHAIFLKAKWNYSFFFVFFLHFSKC